MTEPPSRCLRSGDFFVLTSNQLIQTNGKVREKIQNEKSSPHDDDRDQENDYEVRTHKFNTEMSVAGGVSIIAVTAVYLPLDPAKALKQYRDNRGSDALTDMICHLSINELLGIPHGYQTDATFDADGLIANGHWQKIGLSNREHLGSREAVQKDAGGARCFLDAGGYDVVQDIVTVILITK